MPHAPQPSYWTLPASVREAIADKIGPVDSASPVGVGNGVAVAAVVSTRQGRFFVKALPGDREAWTQQREATLAPYLLPVAAPLIAHLQRGWDILIFEALAGATANYSPGSSDLPAVAELLTRIGRLACPGIVELNEAPLQLQSLVNDPDLPFFAGPTLLHTDLAATHVIVEGNRARLVSWGMAARGAAWLDAAYWALQLIAAGHEPAAAEDVAARVPAWQRAPAHAVTLFVTVQARLRRTASDGEALRAAARRWLEYRRSLPT